MKKMKFTAAALSMLLVLGSCGTSQKTGTAVGAGSGAACTPAPTAQGNAIEVAVE